MNIKKLLLSVIVSLVGVGIAASISYAATSLIIPAPLQPAVFSASGNVVGSSTPTTANYVATSTSAASVFPLANITKLSNLTTNGFVKTSSGNGTLSIDTNTYLQSAITSLGAQFSTAQTGAAQTIASSTTGTDFSITSTGNTTTFNLPTASASNRGLLSSTDWTTFNGKLSSALTSIGPTGQTTSGPTVAIASSSAGTDFSITGSGSTLTFNLPTASASNRGLLSSTDWSTFNSKGSGTVTSINNGSTGSTLTFSGGAITTSGTINGEINLGHSNIWTVLQQFTGNASSTQISVPQKAYFGSTATTTIDSAGNVSVAGTLSVTGQSTLSQASSTQTSIGQLYVGQTGTTTITNAGIIGVGTSTPAGAITTDRKNGIASSSITSYEYRYGSGTNIATSTAATIDGRTSNTIHWPIGTAGTTLTLTGMVPGQQLMVVVENPNAVAGALTWAVSSGYILLWAGGTTPTQTTTANKMDVWSFKTTQGSSTNVILGAQTPTF